MRVNECACDDRASRAERQRHSRLLSGRIRAVEILAAGEWKKYIIGIQDYTIDNPAFNELPKGKTLLELITINDSTIKQILQWRATDAKGIGLIQKEALIRK